jgi:hypothetical protein
MVKAMFQGMQKRTQASASSTSVAQPGWFRWDNEGKDIRRARERRRRKRRRRRKKKEEEEEEEEGGGNRRIRQRRRK